MGQLKRKGSEARGPERPAGRAGAAAQRPSGDLVRWPRRGQTGGHTDRGTGHSEDAVAASRCGPGIGPQTRPH
ncbi:Hypothetical predicted protein [Marmota monax]|uniref:Uncharacterized protein n=1 Tax=Marmota monax TaxID=9995 RepID=A0A5E4AWL6_MARMO|nr:hypothetical protein GHT09_015187 [Marmota monax]VTJ61151.1 Hypothetical predicted protein [Marmota monax]